MTSFSPLGIAHQGNHPANVVGDFLRCHIDPLSQLAYLIGNHCKTTPHLAGPRSLNCGIERKQIGLVGNILDQTCNLANAVRTLSQMANGVIK